MPQISSRIYTGRSPFPSFYHLSLERAKSLACSVRLPLSRRPHTSAWSPPGCSTCQQFLLQPIQQLGWSGPFGLVREHAAQGQQLSSQRGFETLASDPVLAAAATAAAAAIAEDVAAVAAAVLHFRGLELGLVSNRTTPPPPPQQLPCFCSPNRFCILESHANDATRSAPDIPPGLSLASKLPAGGIARSCGNCSLWSFSCWLRVADLFWGLWWSNFFFYHPVCLLSRDNSVLHV